MVRDDVLDSLLIRWHHWAKAEQIATGYPAECPSCRLYVTSRQYDDSNGALDESFDVLELHAVDRCIQALASGLIAVIAANAQALAAKWDIPEYPAGVIEARRELWKRLATEGVV